MKQHLARWYPLLASGLVVLWIIWLLVPLGEFDPYGGMKLVGFFAIEMLFLGLGILGLVLCYEKLIIFELAVSVVMTTPIHLVGLMAQEPLDMIAYALPLIAVLSFSIVLWRRR